MFEQEPIILGDDDLCWTERFRSGVFCFFNGQLGISFKNAHSGLVWQVDRKYCDAPINVDKKVHNITCCLPVLPGTFQPIRASSEQVEVMRYLLDGVLIVEQILEAETTHVDNQECENLRNQLNQFYDGFVFEFGLLSNCKSYYDGIWNDARLEIYLSQLTDDAGNKADIFFKRVNHPPQTLQGQQFFEQDLDERVSKAFSWSMSWYGKVRLDEIAEKSGIDEQIALDILLKVGLVYREWTGF